MKLRSQSFRQAKGKSCSNINIFDDGYSNGHSRATRNRLTINLYPLGKRPIGVVTMHPLFPLSSQYPLPSVQTLSPSALAYVGDAVYELYFRTHYLFPPTRIRDYHQRVVSCVRAETQAAFAKTLLPHLSPEEIRIFKQGRNAATGHPKRIRLEVYQHATGLETLVGYLYLTDRDRLQEILKYFSFDENKSAEL